MPAAKEPAKKLSFSELIAKAAKEDDLRVASINDIVEDVPSISTGNIAIDEAIGVGGVPRGRSLEFFGPPASGKTSTALQVLAEEQQRIIAEGSKEYLLFADFEHALDFEYAESLGIDTSHDSFKYFAPDTFEQGGEFIKKAIMTGEVRLIIVDSIAAMTPKAIAEGEVGQQTIALQARLLSMFGKQLNPILDKHNCTIIFLNHELEEMPAIGGPPRSSYLPAKVTTPGGKSPKFFASVRLRFKQTTPVKSKVYDPITDSFIEKVDSYEVLVKVEKNKVAAPFKEAKVRTRFGKGIDNFWTAAEILKTRKLVQASGAWISTTVPELIPTGGTVKEGKWQVNGEEKLLKFADEHPEWRQTWINRAKEEIEKSKESRKTQPVSAVDDDDEEEVE